MTSKVHVPIQFPGAIPSSDSASAGSRWIGKWWIPLSGIWSIILRLRHFLYDAGALRSHSGPLPTLVVGSVELGGSGKTPHVIDFAHRLGTILGSSTVGVLSRGYGRRGSEFLWVSEAHDWRQTGDEPWLMQRMLPESPVAVCVDRVEGLYRMAADKPELRVVILDDGLQHRPLRPTLSIGLKTRRTPPSWWSWTEVVPSGRYRDLPYRLNRCDQVVATTNNGAQTAHDFQSKLRTSSPKLAWPLDDPQVPPIGPALLITGIARPGRVVQSILEHAVDLKGHAHYPDHHAFEERDLEHWRNWLESHDHQDIITTEKDAIRISPLLNENSGFRLWTLPIQIEWSNPDLIQSFLNSWAKSLTSS